MQRAMTEPERLLEEYQSHLDEHGGILPTSVSHLIQLMQSAQCKLVPKCISLCILSSSSADLQSQLCQAGAWDILLKWLQEAVKDENYTFLVELLHVYLHLPVRLDQLTKNVCPKIINSLTKRCEHEEVRYAALEIVKKWKNVISTDSRRKEPPDLKRKKSTVKTQDEPEVETVTHEQKRRRTVKMLPTAMRTAGVEDVSHTQPKSRCEVLAKKSKLDPDARIGLDPSIESFHRKISVSPTENKKTNEFHESSDFINALTNTAPPVVRKKRKVIPKVETSTPTEPIQVKGNCLVESSERGTENPATESIPASPVTPIGMGSRKSSLMSLSSTFSDAKPKKRVSWADEEKLHSFYYFELDESERVNVNRVSVEDIRRKELSMERQLFRRSSDDSGVSMQKWSTPPPLERIFLVEFGYKSIERQTQTERERYVLQAIYFTRESVPDSPEEPDTEIVEPATPLNIPLEDLTVLDQTSNDDGFPGDSLLMVKDTTGTLQMSLNPEIADLVKSLAANLSNTPSSGPIVDQPVVSKPSDPEKPSIPAESEKKQDNPKKTSSGSKMLQEELWEVLEENYPDVNVYELSTERIRDLLEPLRDQLVARGIFQIPHSDVYLPPPPVVSTPPAHTRLLPPRPPLTPSLPPALPFNPPHCGPPSDFPTRPPLHSMMAHPDFVPDHMGPGFRHQAPCLMFPGGPPPPPFARGGGPPPHHPPMRQGAPLPPFPGPGFMMRPRSSQPCRFFQQGTCRNGASCNFLHTKK